MSQVFRVERTKNFTVMSNHHFKNKNLSLKAKGLLSLMLSLPDDWNYFHAEVHAVDLDDLGRQRLPGAEALRKGDVGKDLLAPFPLNQRCADAGHILRLTAAGEDLTLFVDADDAVLQTLQ